MVINRAMNTMRMIDDNEMKENGRGLCVIIFNIQCEMYAVPLLVICFSLYVFCVYCVLCCLLCVVLCIPTVCFNCVYD